MLVNLASSLIQLPDPRGWPRKCFSLKLVVAATLEKTPLHNPIKMFLLVSRLRVFAFFFSPNIEIRRANIFLLTEPMTSVNGTHKCDVLTLWLIISRIWFYGLVDVIFFSFVSAWVRIGLRLALPKRAFMLLDNSR